VDLGDVRSSNRTLDTLKFEYEKEMSKQSLEVAVLSQQLKDKEDVIEKMTALIDGGKVNQVCPTKQLVSIQDSFTYSMFLTCYLSSVLLFYRVIWQNRSRCISPSNPSWLGSWKAASLKSTRETQSYKNFSQTIEI